MPSRPLRLFLALACSLALGPVALAQTPAPVVPPAPAAPPVPAAAALRPAQAQQALELLRDDRRRAELISTLDAIAKAVPPRPDAPATNPAPPASVADAPAAALPLAPDSLGAELVTQSTAAASQAGIKLLASFEAVNDLPLLWRWLVSKAADPAARAQLGEAGWKLLVVFACALAAEWGARWLLRPFRGTLGVWAPASPDAEPPAAEHAEPGTAEAAKVQAEEANSRRVIRAVSALRRLPYLLGRLLLDLAPLALFAVVAALLLGTPLGTPRETRQAGMAAGEAYLVCSALLIGAALLVSPAVPRLRLLHVTDWAALFLTRWVRRVAVIGTVGYTLGEVGHAFGMYLTAQDALLKLTAFAIHLCLIAAVLQARVPVRRRLRAPHNARGAWAAARNGLSDVWHLVAIFLIVALWLVWAAELRNGYVRLVNFCLVTAGLLVASRLVAVLVLGALDRLRLGRDESAAGLASRLAVYYPVVRTGVTAVLGFATVFALLEGWGFSPIRWFTYGGLGSRALAAVMQLGFAVLMAVLLWEGANAGVERHVAQLTGSGQLARAGRLRTLLPMLRTILFVTIVLVVALMALSELGVNIAPLLAGAGVIGIAVGFGSQKLVQDLITGLFLLLENAMQVGDVVTLGGLTGTVEALSIRTIRLRAVDGAVHLIPFSAVTTVTNQTRDYSYAVLDVSVGLNEEPDRIGGVLRGVASEMRADPKWSPVLLEPLDVMGVERFIDTAWVMRVRMKTQPGSRWTAMRELNRRIKLRFDELAIESPLTSYRALSTPPAAAAASTEEAAA